MSAEVTEAACLGLPTEWFYPEVGRQEKYVAAAKAICAECASRLACLDTALEEGQEFGIWGGLVAAERARLAALMAVARDAPSSGLTREAL